MPQISVIVPVYRVEPYLRRCVDSILGQSYSDFDLVLVDDGSPDRCGEICDAYAVGDLRVHVLHQENRGLSAARNAGIEWALEHSDSDWISFVDSDDWVHPGYLEALLSAATRHAAEVAIGGFFRTHGEPLPEADLSACTVVSPETFYLNETVNATVAWGKLYKKVCFRDIRYPEGKIHEDEYTTYRILFGYDRVVVVEAPIYAYFQNENGIMGRKWTVKRMDALQALEEQTAFFDGRGYAAIAERRFRSLLYYLRLSRDMLKTADELQEDERKRMIRALNQKQRSLLLQYRDRKWISIWNRGDDLHISAEVYPGIRFLYFIWRQIKRILRKT